jgi:hypothetical protein
VTTTTGLTTLLWVAAHLLLLVILSLTFSWNATVHSNKNPFIHIQRTKREDCGRSTFVCVQATQPITAHRTTQYEQVKKETQPKYC